jgi:hypothetical protein
MQHLVGIRRIYSLLVRMDGQVYKMLLKDNIPDDISEKLETILQQNTVSRGLLDWIINDGKNKG